MSKDRSGSGGPRRTVGRPAKGAEVRDDLLAAALGLLEASGDPREVTVGRIVAAARCTPPSLYHYWPSREALLVEASARGYAAFRVDLTRAVAGADDPIERILRRGRGYVAFAFARPALFRVLFLDRPVAGAPEARPSAPGAGLQDLVDDVTSAMEAGRLASGDPLLAAVALWSAVHGVAALWIATPGLPPDLAERTLELQQRALLAGLVP